MYLYVEWFNDEENTMCLSRLPLLQAIFTHLCGFGKITFNVEKEKN